jgi:hypothetical protein
MEEEGEDVMDARLLDLFANSHLRPEARHETLEAVPHQARIIIFYIYIKTKTMLASSECNFVL